MPEIRCRRCGEPVPPGADKCSHCGAPAPEDVTTASSGPLTRFQTGDIVEERYEVVEILPTGGMGELYKVRHLHLGDYRVIKLRKPSGKKDETGKKRFLREARIAATIKHPNLATLYDFSTLPDGANYMVFEYVDGLTIAEHIKAGGRFETTQVLHAAEQTLKALAVLHAEGIVHRDIASDNLMLAADPLGKTIVKVIDLGIAKPLEGEGLTSTGFFVGKARYASPEQVNTQDPEPIDTRSDIYSLGVVLYEMVSGDVPFSSSTPAASVIKRLTEDITTVPPRDTEMSLEPDVEAFILALLRRDRDERVTSADEALKMVQDLLSQRPDSGDGSALARITRDRELHRLAAPTGDGEIPVPRKGTLEMSLDEIQKAQLNDLKESTYHGTPKEPAQPDPTPQGDQVEETENLPKLRKTEREAILREAVAEESGAAEASTEPGAPSGDDDAPPTEPTRPNPDQQAPTMPFAKYGRAHHQPVVPSVPDEQQADDAPSTTEPLPKPTPKTRKPEPEKVTPESERVTEVPPSQPKPLPQAAQAARTPVPSSGVPRVTIAGKPIRKKTIVIVLLLLVFALVALTVAGWAAYRIVQKLGGEAPVSAGAKVAESTAAEPEPEPEEAVIEEVVEYGPELPADFVAPPPPEPEPPPKPVRRAPPPPPPPEPEPEPEPEIVEVEPEVPKVEEGDIVQLGPDVQDVTVIAKAPLKLPMGARFRRAKGTATIDVLIGINGVPDEVRMVKRSGDEKIDKAALEAAQNSRFLPAMKDGVRVRMWKRMDFGNED